MIEHSVTHFYQPTNNSCSQAALATVLSFFGKNLTPEEILAKVPVNKNEIGEDIGTINQHLATWCLSQNFNVEMFTADFELIDLSWSELSSEMLINKMELTKTQRDVPALGKKWSEIYTQAYIDFIKAGGQLRIRPFMTSELLDSSMVNSPLLLSVSLNVLYNTGRDKNVGLRKTELDDLKGKLTNHSIVIYGKNDSGNYLVADPFVEPGLHTIEPERMLAAMAAAQTGCDNLFFLLTEKVD